MVKLDLSKRCESIDKNNVEMIEMTDFGRKIMNELNK